MTLGMQSERYINSAIGDLLLSQIIPHISANMAILNLQGVPFHPVVVICLGYDILFKFLLGHCALVNATFGSEKKSS